MENFVPEKHHLREVLLHYFILKKSAAESHRMLVEAYGIHALSETTCRDWFRRFKNKDFDVEDKERSGQPKKFEDTELQALLDEDDTQTQEQLSEVLNVDRTTVSKRLKAMGKIQKCGKWVPHELTERQMENRKNTCSGTQSKTG
jgi:transposase